MSLPAAPVSKLRATYDDVVNVPEHLVAEIIGGELILTPRPGPAPARVPTFAGRRSKASRSI